KENQSSLRAPPPVRAADKPGAREPGRNWAAFVFRSPRRDAPSAASTVSSGPAGDAAHEPASIDRAQAETETDAMAGRAAFGAPVSRGASPQGVAPSAERAAADSLSDGAGMPLSPAERRWLEPRVGGALDEVRVDSSPRAAGAADALS